MNRVKQNWGKLALSASIIVGSGGVALADGAAFDYTTYSTILTGGLAVVGSVAAGIAAIKGGVMVWKKIASYFNRAG